VRKNGVKTELQTSVKLAETLRLSTSAAHFSDGYRELTDALNDDFQPYSSTYSTSLAWFTPLAGHLAQVLTTTKGSGDSRNLFFFWGKTFKYASVSVNWQRAIGSQNDDTFYVNLSIPLGGSQSVSTYMRKQGKDNSYGVQNSGACRRI
jgi:outer membrane usher protein FimD/PapC